MRWLIGILVFVAFAITAAAVVFFINGSERTWQMIAGDADFGPMDLTSDWERSSRPNDALLCSTGLCSEKRIDLVLPTYDLTPDALLAKIENTLRGSDIAFERVDDGSDAYSMRFVTRTSTLGFPDTNYFQAVEMPDGTTGLIAYARAQLGYSDAGNNFKRLSRLTAGLSAQ